MQNNNAKTSSPQKSSPSPSSPRGKKSAANNGGKNYRGNKPRNAPVKPDPEVATRTAVSKGESNAPKQAAETYVDPVDGRLKRKATLSPTQLRKHTRNLVKAVRSFDSKDDDASPEEVERLQRFVEKMSSTLAEFLTKYAAQSGNELVFSPEALVDSCRSNLKPKSEDADELDFDTLAEMLTGSDFATEDWADCSESAAYLERLSNTTTKKFLTLALV